MKLTKSEFLNKIENEGGYEGAFISYGLTIDDLAENALSPDLREELNNRIEEFYQAYVDLQEFITDYMNEDIIDDADNEDVNDLLSEMDIEFDSDNNEID